MAGIMAQVTSHAQRLGSTEAVTAYEPEAAPGGRGLTVSVSLAGLAPAKGGSGLTSTTVRLELAVRLWYPDTVRPPERGEIVIATTADALMRAYSGAFTLGDEVMNVDLLARYGTGLEGRAGYATVDGEVYRVFTITLPLIVRDLWAQSP